MIEDCGYEIRLEKGVFQLYDDGVRLDYEYPNLGKFIKDMHLLCALIADGPLKSFCYRRLSYLSSKFQLHVLLNELRELAAQKAVAHRDFYNVRKVRTSTTCSGRLFFFNQIFSPGRYPYSRCLLHESKTFASLHQKGLKDRSRHGCVQNQGGQRHDLKRGLHVYEFDGLWPHCRHAGCARGKSVLFSVWWHKVRMGLASNAELFFPEVGSCFNFIA